MFQTCMVFAGKKGTAGNVDASDPKNALFHHPIGIAVDDRGSLFVCDQLNYSIRKINIADGKVSTYAKWNGTDANRPKFLTLNTNVENNSIGMEIYFTQTSDQVRKIRKNLDVKAYQLLASTVAGVASEHPFWRDGFSWESHFDSPTGIAMNSSDGCLFVTDRFNHVRKAPTCCILSCYSLTNIHLIGYSKNIHKR